MIFWLNLNLRLFFSEKFAVAHNYSGILRMISIMASFFYLILFLVNSENFLPVFLFLNLGVLQDGVTILFARESTI